LGSIVRRFASMERLKQNSELGLGNDSKFGGASSSSLPKYGSFIPLSLGVRPHRVYLRPPIRELKGSAPNNGGTPTRSFRVYNKVRKILMPQMPDASRLERQRRKKERKGGPSRLRRRVKLIIGVVVTLAVLVCSATYLLVVHEWPSTEGRPVTSHEAPQGETELLRSGEPTRTVWLGEYSYDVRFYDASGNEAAGLGASIRREPGAAIQYRLTVNLAHHVETWEMLLDGPDPSTTHLESLSLKFTFNRRIEMLPFPLWLLTPAYPYPPNMSGSFSLESRIEDVPPGSVVLLNFTRLRNLERPPQSPVRWSWISFQFLMTPDSTETRPYFDAFTLEISFTLHLPSGGKVMYEKGTTRALEFQRPAGAASLASSIAPQVAAPLWDRNPLAAWNVCVCPSWCGRLNLNHHFLAAGVVQ